MRITLGNRLRINASFADIEGVAADPDELIIKIRRTGRPATERRYTYGTDAELVKDGVGAYHVVFEPPQTGRWRYYWSGTGSAAGATEGEFSVGIHYQ